MLSNLNFIKVSFTVLTLNDETTTHLKSKKDTAGFWEMWDDSWFCR